MLCRWFQARIDVLSVLFISSVAFSSVPLSSCKITLYAILIYTIVHRAPNSTCTCIYFEYLAVDAGLIGLALTYALSMGSIFQYCIKQSTILEGLVSVNICQLLTVFYI